MDIFIKLKEKNEIEKLILTLNLGILESLQNGSMNFDEARNYFYRPYVAQFMELLGSNEELVQLLHDCCLLEDIDRLAPEKITYAINDRKKNTIKLLRKIPKSINPRYWLNDFDNDKN